MSITIRYGHDWVFWVLGVQWPETQPASREPWGLGVGVSWGGGAGPQSHRPLRAIVKRPGVILSGEGNHGGFWSRVEAVKMRSSWGKPQKASSRAVTWPGCYFRRISLDEMEAV